MTPKEANARAKLAHAVQNWHVAMRERSQTGWARRTDPTAETEGHWHTAALVCDSRAQVVATAAAELIECWT